MTDMEGLAGVDSWEQCYAGDDRAPEYLHGLRQLVADTNAAVAGSFDGGATDVVVWDGHGRNGQRGFEIGGLDPRARMARIRPGFPVVFEGLDRETAGVVMVGQHAMAGTSRGFLDHTQIPKTLCRFLINGQEHGEMSQFALYAGHFGVPLIHVSGDEALGEEARRLFPGAGFTATKRGVGWATCELLSPEEVRGRLRKEVAHSVRRSGSVRPWSVALPVQIAVEFAWSGQADPFTDVPGVSRPHARIVSWRIDDARFIYSWPDAGWHPPS